MTGGEGPSEVHKRIDVPEGGLRNVELVLGPAKGQSVQVAGRLRVEGGVSVPKDQTIFLYAAADGSLDGAARRR